MTRSTSKAPSATRPDTLRVLRFPALIAMTSLVILAAHPESAVAQRPAFVPQGAYLYSGPGVGYPLVGTMPPGMQVVTYGCLDGWSWCDVGAGPLRGWAPGPAIQLSWNGMTGPLTQYGPMAGLPLVPFAFGSYWGNHYRGEPWFSDRDRWGGGQTGPGPGGRDRNQRGGPGGPGGGRRPGPDGGQRGGGSGGPGR
ncbi:SH3 domain-containing protein [Acetobacter fallax]|uniref:Peptide-binding protein n=1 Tax=Acetobacter fallax TaxID=1737473 RepID=A0ABX0K7R5_9PROT|nr:hypothetical protein [Acetobacter fallax]NHO31514.1 hypothetical protein [Acetobacter fallax]NHO35073.1 hypothetical protein [Acetobacter fallax]